MPRLLASIPIYRYRVHKHARNRQIKMASLNIGTRFRLPFDETKAKNILAKKYDCNPEDFKRDANGEYVYAPKNRRGQSKPNTNPAPTTQQNNTDQSLMKPTIAWMAQKYEQFNQELFNGELGPCSFTTQSRGYKRLGWFTGSFLAWRDTGRMTSLNRAIKITRENFANVARPVIGMNANYAGTEEALENTLVHEMCHYYTYMYGHAPRQAHGTEFREIASIVCSRSNGRFVITRLASAEEMKNYKLDDRVQQQKDNRKVTKTNNTNVVFIQMKDGTLRLSKTTLQSVIDEIIRIHRKAQNAERIVVLKDPELTRHLEQQGYRKNFRTYRFWRYNGNIDDIMNKFGTTPTQDIHENRNPLHQLVETITEKVMNQITQKTEDDNNDFVMVTPDMDLGQESPLEMN